MLGKISLKNCEHYKWGSNCDGWFLLNREDISIIRESVPPLAEEKKHYHNESRQFFYILNGTATITIEGMEFLIEKNEGIEIPPRTVHSLKNNSDIIVEFLVISFPRSHGDKIIVQ